jgi:hypothetical protein
MIPEITPASWAEGIVDRDLEHMVITYGSILDEGELHPVALVAPDYAGRRERLVVQYLPVTTSFSYQASFSAGPM